MKRLSFSFFERRQRFEGEGQTGRGKAAGLVFVLFPLRCGRAGGFVRVRSGRRMTVGEGAKPVGRRLANQLPTRDTDDSLVGAA